MVEVLVEHDYTAQQPDELTIKKGDVITDVIKKPGGWWEGRLKEKIGMFPDNFVRVVDKDSVVFRNKKDSARIRQCRVVFSYNQDHEDELNLKVGEVIDIIGEEEEGWWRGRLNGKEGVFPSNFVEEIQSTPPSSNKPRPSIREDLNRLSSEPPVLPSKPANQFCEVKFSYKALNEDELNLKEGEIVTLISRDTQDPGWWKGELNGKIGFFPDNFVAILPDDKKPNNVEHKPENIGAIKHSSIASQRKSLEVRKEEPKPSVDKTDSSSKLDGQVSEKTPPLPGKKPLITVKKSPSGSGSGFLSKIKDKIVDTIDGATGSKAKSETNMQLAKENSTEHNNNDVFDQVERTPVLRDVRANRARAPGRRLPTSIYKEDDEEIPGLPNGNVDHSKLEIIPRTQSDNNDTKPEVSSRPESFREKSTDSKSDTLESSSSSEQLDGTEIKPKVREWETKKVPWFEELKANQAKRNSGPSPGPDPRHRLSNPLSEPKLESDGSKSSQNSPAEKEVHLLDMSRSMTDIKTSPFEGGKMGLRAKTPTNELERISPLRSKPALPPASGKPHLGSLPPRDTSSKPVAPQPKLSPKPSLYENTVVSKPPLGGVVSTHSINTAHTSSVLNSSSSVSHSVVTSHVTSQSSVKLSHEAKNYETANSHVVSKAGDILKESEINHEPTEETISSKQFAEVLGRLQKLEAIVEKQSHMIDELKNRLQVESDMRILLQEKLMQNNVQV